MNVAVRQPESGRVIVATARARLAELQASWTVVEAVSLLFRGALAWVFLYHGSQKLFGALDGGGIHGTTEYFASVGIHPARLFAILSALTEFGGGACLALGLLVPLAGFALFVDMLIAWFQVNVHNGFVAEKAAGGYELNMTLAAMALTVALLGAGPVSLDRLLGLARRRSREVP
jgi:putative oxidoreductase